MRSISLLFCGLSLGATTASLAEEVPSDTDDAFTLGQIVITAQRYQGSEIGGSSLSSEAMYTFSRNTLDDAVTLMPGVSSANSGGSRNERLIFVRGFDRFQVPLSLDGIRVYLPADNRLDYGRFLTPDVAEVQVAKGFASVLDGPGAMGGAVNLVTRKPTRKFESELRGSVELDRDVDHSGDNLFSLFGTNQGSWYAQGSYARNHRDHWMLSGDYRPTAGSAEDGGEREFSDTTDSRFNAKIGWTPNAKDEYSLSYTRQEGEKNAPLHVNDPVATQRNWSWPYWDIDSLYFLSNTAFGDRLNFKIRLYTNSFDNLLRSFDDRTQTTQTLGRAFNSYYADDASGASAQVDVSVAGADSLSVTAYYRRDKHVEWQQGFPSGFTEPAQTNLEDTYSVAAENRLTISPALQLTLGASYDWRDLRRAEEYGTPPAGGAATIFSYPLQDAHAFNAQGRLTWTVGEASSAYASISSRARFPTIFERFSTQFGTAASNPGLKAERAINYEIGGSSQHGILRAEGAAFYSDLRDAIVAVRPAGFPANTSQRQNLGNAEYYGAELALTAHVSQTLELGVNYTYIHRSFEIGTPEPGTIVPVFKLTDVPKSKGFLYGSWFPLTGLQVVPSIEFASNRTTVTTAAPTVYYDVGKYVLANLKVDYAFGNGIELGIGGRNLADKNYILTDGFPEAGRTWSATLRARF